MSWNFNLSVSILALKLPYIILIKPLTTKVVYLLQTHIVDIKNQIIHGKEAPFMSYQLGK